MAKRRKKKNENHFDETWLIPYADLLTLLLALFIVLFGMSSIDAQKFRQLAISMNANLTGGTSILEFPSPLPEGGESHLQEKELKNINQDDQKQEQKQEQEQLSDIQQKVNAYIDSKQLNNKLKTSLSDEGLLITIVDDILFDSGKAEVRKKDQKLAREISDLLVMNPPRYVVISGHTDNVPIKNSQFDSNWHLSVMRAVNFLSILLENEKLNPQLFSAKGYGEYKPIASNNTEEGRQKNRRVEILILPYGENENTSP